MDRQTDTSLLRPVDLALALVLLTRAPLPPLPPSAFARGAAAAWAWPIAGMVASLPAALVLWLTAYVGLPAPMPAMLALTALVLATGALHEDGLADMADGLWGGRDPAQRLEILRDSQLGSYGALALILSVGLRVAAISATGPLALIVAAGLSRATLPALLRAGPFARDDGLARSVGRPRSDTAGLAAGIGAAVALLAFGPALALVVIAGAAATGVGVLILARRKLGGITGDVLGGAQQCAEIAVLLVLAGGLA